MKLDIVFSNNKFIIRSSSGQLYDTNPWEIHDKIINKVVDKIYTRGILQHLTFRQLDLTLKSWLKILKPGGELEIIVPDVVFYINQFLDPQRKIHKLANGKTLQQSALSGICGEQIGDSVWNFHKSVYDLDLLNNLLTAQGFIAITQLKDAPQNLHLISYKPTENDTENYQIYKRAELAYQKSHLGGHGHTTHIDEGVLRFIVDNYPIKSMVDIGCGPGGMVKIAKKMGLKVIGVDGDERMSVNDDCIKIHDFCKGKFELLKNQHFDLAWSVEFLEHVEEKYMVNYMPLFAQADIVVCTAAPPGSGGYHHVNEQPLEYWFDKFRQYGFVYRDDLTKQAKLHSTMERDFFLRSGMIFTKD